MKLVMIISCVQGNVVLCGFRNGAIVTVDVRKRQRGCSSRAGRRHQIPYSRLQRNDRVTNEQWFEVYFAFLFIYLFNIFLDNDCVPFMHNCMTRTLFVVDAISSYQIFSI